MKRLLFLAVCIFTMVSCGGSPNKNTKDEAQLAKDSTALVALFNKEIKVGENILTPIPTEVVQFSNTNCRLYVWLPEDREGTSAQSLATKKCTEAVKWLRENGYDLESGGIYVSCYVYSKYSGGVTGRDDLVTRWGHARYNYLTDQVEWEQED